MSSTPNSLPSFGATLPSARNTTVARDLSLPFRRDVNAPWQVPLNFKVLSSDSSYPLAYHFSRQNPQNSRAQTTFCYAEASNNLDVETQSLSAVDEIPVRQFYGQKFTVCMLIFFLFPWLRGLTSFSTVGCCLAATVGHQGLWRQDHSTLKPAMVGLRKETISVIETRVFFFCCRYAHGHTFGQTSTWLHIIDCYNFQCTIFTIT